MGKAGVKNHNGTGTRLYEIWKGMRKRCYSKSRAEYKNYGGRGIKICEEWDDYTKFREWALENGYSDELTIDRIDYNGDYCPDNCRWTTVKEQSNHKRNNLYVTIDGQTNTVSEWSEILNFNRQRVYNRIHKGISPADAIREFMKA